MQYSKLLFVLPLASAAIVARQDVVEMDYVTAVETQWVTQYGTAPPVAAPTEAPPAPPAPPAQPSAADANTGSGHGHGHVHSYNPASNYQPPSTWSAPPPPPPSYTAPAPPPPSDTAPPSQPSAPSASAPAPSASSGAGGSGSGGCPADTSGKYLSPSVDASGNPAGGAGKSMIDSMNYIRRLYNESAACLSWSDSLASASGDCANKGNEVDCCRANSNVISDTQYGSDGYKGPLASSVFEGSMFMMLCQSPGDAQLQGTCTGKTGEESYTGVGSQTSQCTSGACTGHHDAIVDAEGTNHFMGVASSSASGQSYMSCSFSATNNIFD